MKIAVLVSGGVDSSLALAMLKQAGHDVTAFFLKVWLEEERLFPWACPWEEDVGYARAVCERLGVPLEIVALQRDYHDRILDYALGEARAGRTPNPDMLCNREIKFGIFDDLVGRDYDRVASGHYARLIEHGGRLQLVRGPDAVKDQTYFLARLTDDQLARALFPIGDLDKRRVRQRAAALGLPTAARKDSQGLCFLGKIPFREFLRHYLGERPGPIVEVETGRVLGRHCGYWFHTIGQRRGLGLSGGPWYVTGKDPGEDIVFVSLHPREAPGADGSFKIADLRWRGEPPHRSRALETKVRHGPHTTRCRVEPIAEDTARVFLETPDAGIAPGQFAVFYDGEVCVGSGVIDG